MSAEKAYLLDTNVVGRKYYEADDVWSSLGVGVKLIMQRENDNQHDPYAVSLSVKSGDHIYKLGYLPRVANELVAIMMTMGWEDAFECVISRLDEMADYDKQIGVILKVCRRKAETYENNGTDS